MADKFYPEQFTRETCEALNLEVCNSFRANSFEFPEGWKSVVLSMLQEMRGCNVQIFSIRNDHGMLDVRVVASPESEITTYRTILVAQQWANTTCEVCGVRGSKMVLGGKVQVLCKGCVDKNKEN